MERSPPQDSFQHATNSQKRKTQFARILRHRELFLRSRLPQNTLPSWKNHFLCPVSPMLAPTITGPSTVSASTPAAKSFGNPLSTGEPYIFATSYDPNANTLFPTSGGRIHKSCRYPPRNK